MRRSTGLSPAWPAALVLAGLLAGCATAPPPGAVTTFARTDCATTADLSAAISLTPPKQKEKAVHTVVTPVKADTPCLRREGTASPYVLYALPADLHDKSVIVGGVLEAARIVSPDVRLLDSRGAVVRTFPPTDYYYRGPVFSVQFTPRPGEAYVLVDIDPSRVGQRYDSIAIGTSTVSTYAAGATISWRSGVDTSQSRTFSYEGSVQATVFDSEVKKP